MPCWTVWLPILLQIIAHCNEGSVMCSITLMPRSYFKVTTLDLIHILGKCLISCFTSLALDSKNWCKMSLQQTFPSTDMYLDDHDDSCSNGVWNICNINGHRLDSTNSIFWWNGYLWHPLMLPGRPLGRGECWLSAGNSGFCPTSTMLHSREDTMKWW